MITATVAAATETAAAIEGRAFHLGHEACIRAVVLPLLAMLPADRRPEADALIARARQAALDVGHDEEAGMAAVERILANVAITPASGANSRR